MGEAETFRNTDLIETPKLFMVPPRGIYRCAGNSKLYGRDIHSRGVSELHGSRKLLLRRKYGTSKLPARRGWKYSGEEVWTSYLFFCDFQMEIWRKPSRVLSSRLSFPSLPSSSSPPHHPRSSCVCFHSWETRCILELIYIPKVCSAFSSTFLEPVHVVKSSDVITQNT